MQKAIVSPDRAQSHAESDHQNYCAHLVIRVSGQATIVDEPYCSTTVLPREIHKSDLGFKRIRDHMRSHPHATCAHSVTNAAWTGIASASGVATMSLPCFTNSLSTARRPQGTEWPNGSRRRYDRCSGSRHHKRQQYMSSTFFAYWKQVVLLDRKTTLQRYYSLLPPARKAVPVEGRNMASNRLSGGRDAGELDLRVMLSCLRPAEREQ